MSIGHTYKQGIDWIQNVTGVPDYVLHVHVGMLIFCLARLVLGRSFGSFVPLLVVTAAEIGNELLDRLADGGWNWHNTALDLVNTLLWPLVLTLAVRLRPALARRRAGAPIPPAAPLSPAP